MASSFVTQYHSPLVLLLITFLLATPLFLHLRARQFHSSLRQLSGKHVWVVGASRGIGRSTALQFASHGAIVSISSRTTATLRTLASQLGSQLGAVVPLDVTDGPDALRSALRHLLTVAPIDIVIANAGINHSARPFTDLDAPVIDAVLDTNFRAVAHLFSVVLPPMLHRGGTLCAISSLAAYRGVPGGSVYAASKAAVTSMCQSLAIELYASKVDVVCVHPGFVDTTAIRDVHHPKPFIVSEREAGDQVVRAVVMRASHYAFPWIMETIVMPFSQYLPTAIYTFIMHHTS